MCWSFLLVIGVLGFVVSIWVNGIKPWFDFRLGWYGVILCAISMVYLDGCCATGGLDKEYWRDSHYNDGQPGQLDCADIIPALKQLGFLFVAGYNSGNIPSLFCNNLAPSISTHTSRSTSSFSVPIENVPDYWVGFSQGSVYFEPPEVIDKHWVKHIQSTLRMISCIRVVQAQVRYKPNSPELHGETLCILSRIINMFDCEYLSISLGWDIADLSYTNKIDYTALLTEAYNTVQDVTYAIPCQISFGIIEHSDILSLIMSGVAPLRPISSVFLRSRCFEAISLLGQLALAKDYVLIIEPLAELVHIDFGLLLSSSPTCSQITINDHPTTRMFIAGLENAIKLHPELILCLSCDTIKHLCLYNAAEIQIHTLLGFEVNKDTVIHLEQLSGMNTASPIKIIAHKVVAEVQFGVPCRLFDHHRKLYTPTNLAKIGIKASTVTIYYKKPRDDVLNTTLALCQINALLKPPQIISSRLVFCDGQSLNDTNWRLDMPISIDLNHPKFEEHLGFYIRNSIPFCQNMKYCGIEISGSKVPIEKQDLRCIQVLSLFRNLDVNTLMIRNVRTRTRPTCNFILDHMMELASVKDKWSFNANLLVLDNVDICIVYWMLAHYEFAKPVKIYMLNQRFKNLGIAQVLNTPIGQHIEFIAINDFLELNEVIYYTQEENIVGFSIFNYVKSHNHSHIESLHLDKLHMRLNGIDFGHYGEILDVFSRYKITLMIGLPKLVLDEM
ncbi:hypothetical protein NEHOM01_0329 [Nematocida homosporus]|uniref:uncharacterized protein n=1 Tax=Nematocida homosporus TaxID=1912981 RepID=UPI0022201741|nr:uncharacterized protein NEHOM01_0329 [Nematocida homosporus]KAI5184727.1 hypothetical protein NEHOM01_0329 [Nematocida homosporus]